MVTGGRRPTVFLLRLALRQRTMISFGQINNRVYAQTDSQLDPDYDVKNPYLARIDRPDPVPFCRGGRMTGTSGH